MEIGILRGGIEPGSEVREILYLVLGTGNDFLLG